jgi:ferredoxin
VGEHFHIVTALPALFFARPRPANAVPAVDLERDDDRRRRRRPAGGRAHRARPHLEGGLDAFTCTECGRCKDACPTFLTGKPLSLKWVHDSLKHHLLEQREAIVAAKGRATLPALVGRGDQRGHAVGLHHLRLLRGTPARSSSSTWQVLPLRQHQVMMEGEFPHELKTVFEAYESRRAIPGACRPTARRLGAGLDVPLLRTPPRSRGSTGCSTSARRSPSTRAGRRSRAPSSNILRAAGVRFGILGPAKARPANACAGRQRDAVPDAGARWSRR